jgi:hypothetical protein
MLPVVENQREYLEAQNRSHNLWDVNTRLFSLRPLVLTLEDPPIVHSIQYLLDHGSNEPDSDHDYLGAKTIVIAKVSRSVCHHAEAQPRKGAYKEGLSSAR